jgi:hypothetical protein
VAISDRTRKILWARASARCSLCRVQVAGDPTDTDDPSVFGEEAHIAARSPGGPRARQYAGDIDGYDNLILLCSRHHKEIDDQVNAYTEARLLEIKKEHEIWASQLGEKRDPGPIRRIPDPAHRVPKMLKLYTSGTAFWNDFDGCFSFTASRPEGLSEEHEDLLAEFFQDVEDWMDIAGGAGATYSMKRDASRAMSRHITELAKAGFLLGARKRHTLLTGGVDAPPVPWGEMDIEIQPASVALLADENGRPLTTEATAQAGREPRE